MEINWDQMNRPVWEMSKKNESKADSRHWVWVTGGCGCLQPRHGVLESVSAHSILEPFQSSAHGAR